MREDAKGDRSVEVSSGTKFVNCERRSYQFGDGIKFNQQGRASLFEISLRDADSGSLDLEGGLLFKRVRTKERLGGAGAVAHLESVIEVGLRSAYGPNIKPESFARNIAYPLDYMLDSDGRISGVVIPKAPPRFFRASQYESDYRPQVFHHVIGDAQKGAIGSVALAEILRKLSGAAARLHDSGFVHGDLSSSNVLCSLGERNSVLLVDCDGLNDLRIKYGERGFTPEWTDPRVAHGKVKWHDIHSDRYSLALFALRAATLEQSIDHIGYLLRRESLSARTSPELLELFDRAFSEPLRADGRPTATDWLQFTTELTRVGEGLVREKGFNFANRAKSHVEPTRVKAYEKAKDDLKQLDDRPSLSARMPILHRVPWMWTNSRATRRAESAKASPLVRETIGRGVAFSWLPIILILIAADFPELGRGGLRLSLTYLLPLGGGWALAVAAMIFARIGQGYSFALFGQEQPRSIMRIPGWGVLAVAAVLAGPLMMVIHALSTLDGPFYLPPGTAVVAIYSVPAMIAALALLRILVASFSKDGRFVRGAGLVLIELVAVALLTALSTGIHASMLRIAENEVRDDSVLQASNGDNCRATAPTRPWNFRQWRAAEISCRTSGVQHRVTSLASSGATSAFATSRSHEVKKRSHSSASTCRARGGVYDGTWYSGLDSSVTRGRLLCFSQGPRSVIEWSDPARHRYQRYSARVSRSALYRFWKSHS